MAAKTKNTSNKSITTGKAKSIARENKYGFASHKVSKQQDAALNKAARTIKKSGKPNWLADAAPKSVATGVKKIAGPKPKGGRGLRGGALGGGRIGQIK